MNSVSVLVNAFFITYFESLTYFQLIFQLFLCFFGVINFFHLYIIYFFEPLIHKTHSSFFSFFFFKLKPQDTFPLLGFWYTASKKLIFFILRIFFKIFDQFIRDIFKEYAEGKRNLSKDNWWAGEVVPSFSFSPGFSYFSMKFFLISYRLVSSSITVLHNMYCKQI